MGTVREEAIEGRGTKGGDEGIQGEEAQKSEKRKERERSSC